MVGLFFFFFFPFLFRLKRVGNSCNIYGAFIIYE